LRVPFLLRFGKCAENRAAGSRWVLGTRWTLQLRQPDCAQPRNILGLGLVHNIDPKLKRAVPYGVYDINNNVGWVSVGTDRDTASFAVNTIRRRWRVMGRKRYPKAKRLMIAADGGGSNGYRTRLWKIELQHLADELRLPITVCHLPPGTSKWNKVEHRLFSFISMNWRGKPLRSYRTVVQLIAATGTDTDLTVRAELDENKYPKGIKVSDAQFATISPNV
jgi:Rhodopirellula transposase DDE domain